ncbi:unnamed protein product [Heterobilharzia americana]|nr:unnamed protein product [Heterobilharzia americana]
MTTTDLNGINPHYCQLCGCLQILQVQSSAKVESDGCVEIQLDPDVEWMPSTETHLSLIRNGISSSQQWITYTSVMLPYEFSHKFD